MPSFGVIAFSDCSSPPSGVAPLPSKWCSCRDNPWAGLERIQAEVKFGSDNDWVMPNCNCVIWRRLGLADVWDGEGSAGRFLPEPETPCWMNTAPSALDGADQGGESCVSAAWLDAFHQKCLTLWLKGTWLITALYRVTLVVFCRHFSLVRSFFSSLLWLELLSWETPLGITLSSWLW